MSVVTQFYVTEAENEYVIRGNAAVMKCKIPSFVADFVGVVAWVADDGSTYMHSPRDDTGNQAERLLTCFCFCFKVVTQSYEAEADNEYVIRGNAAIMKCEVPSFVADFVSVEMWTDSDGNSYLPSKDYGNHPHCFCTG